MKNKFKQPCLIFREFEPLEIEVTYLPEQNMNRIWLKLQLPNSYFHTEEVYKPVFVKQVDTSDTGEALEHFKGILINQLYQDVINWAIHSKFGWKFNFDYNKWERVGEPVYKR